MNFLEVSRSAYNNGVLSFFSFYNISNSGAPLQPLGKITGIMRSGRIHRGMESGYLRNSFNQCELHFKKWNKILLLLNVVAVSLDPLFFYIPVINDDKKCHGLDKKLKIIAIVLRAFTDISDIIINIFFHFYNGSATAKRYLHLSFIVDVLAFLPIPQVVILYAIPHMRGSKILDFRNLFIFFVIFQYVPRLLRIYPLYKKVKKTSGILTEAWAKAVFNLFLFMLASHVLGASWYFFSIERETACWRKACRSQTGCITGSFYCDGSLGNKKILNEFCPIKTPNATLFDFGIFLDALQSGIVESTDFPEKFFHCFWWGLQNLRLNFELKRWMFKRYRASVCVSLVLCNQQPHAYYLSSFGQNLNTSRYMWENCFAVFITLSGLVLFISFIGNMQVYLQSKTIRQEEMRLKGRDIEQWTCFRLLSEDLQKQIRSYQRYKWRKTRGVDIESSLLDLPRDLRTTIKCELCWDLIKRVPWVVNDQMIDAMCDRLKLELYTEECYIVREGDPVNHMLFVMQGELLSWTGNGERVLLKMGDFCGQELLDWAMDPHSSPNVPSSTRNVQALVEVEAFALAADDLKKIILAQHPQPLQQSLPSLGATWYASKSSSLPALRQGLPSLGATWYASKSSSLPPLRQGSPSLGASSYASKSSSLSPSLPSFGATAYASKFATTLRGLRQRKGTLVPLEMDSDALMAKMV